MNLAFHLSVISSQATRGHRSRRRGSTGNGVRQPIGCGAYAVLAFLTLAGSQIHLAAQQPGGGAALNALAISSDAHEENQSGSSLYAGVAPESSSLQDASSSQGPYNWPDDADSDVQQAAAKDAPAQQAAKDGDPGDRAPQTKRILGIIPNFRAISTDEKLPPQSVKEKFITATQDSFDYSSVVLPALLAGYSLARNSTPEFGHGGLGYGRYLWHAAVDQTSENYMVEFVVPALTREDTRYYTLARGTFLKRAEYAASRVVITRSDAGNEVFNLSEVVGAGAAAGLSSLYYPARERSFGNTGKEWGLNLGIDAAADALKEFWPDINHWLFHGAKPDTSPQK